MSVCRLGPLGYLVAYLLLVNIWVNDVDATVEHLMIVIYMENR